MIKKMSLLFFCGLIGVNVFSQNMVDITTAIEYSVSYLIERIPENSKVVVLSISTNKTNISDYITDYLTAMLVNDSSFIVVDRRNLETIQDEINFQVSEKVNDETAVSIGNKIGAQSIISGSFEPLGKNYRFSIRALDVETAKIQATRSFIILENDILLALHGKSVSRGNIANTAKTIDESISSTSEYFLNRIKQNTKVVIFNIASNSEPLSVYVLDKLTEYFVDSSNVIVVDRRNTDLIRQELNFQYSGEVSDKEAISIGKKIGAEIIISGTIVRMGAFYRMNVRAIEVETAEIRGLENYIIKKDNIFISLIDHEKFLEYAAWEYKYLYLGVRPISTIHLYNTSGTEYAEKEIEASYSIDIAAQFSFQITDLFALQTELMFTSDSMNIALSETAKDEYGFPLYTYNTIDSFNSQSLILPVMARFSIKPSIFSINVLGGLYFDVILGSMHHKNSFYGTNIDETRSFQMGYIAGVNLGIKIGPGILFADIRYMGDIWKTKSAEINLYGRNMISIGLGYEMGFFTRNTK
jgi:curli biogenesis system outer membrane secretion channel CsgG